MRGDVYDGRGFVKSSMTGAGSSKQKSHDKDIDLDVKLGTVLGFHGETLRGLDLRVSRRGGVDHQPRAQRQARARYAARRRRARTRQ